MKHYLYAIIVLCAVVLSGCKGDLESAGSGLLTDAEQIVVSCDTSLVIPTYQLPARQDFALFTRPDSFMIGECDSRFGTLRGELLTQLACPIGYSYPAGAVLDSVCLFVYYTSFYGDGLSPLTLNVYELDGEVMNYTSYYDAMKPIDRFISASGRKQSIVTAPRTVVAARPTDSVASGNSYTPFVSFRLKDDWAEHFFETRSFPSQEAFNQLCKGLLITSEFGGSTLLYASDVTLGVYYHYSAPVLDEDEPVRETDVKGFYANEEVRQINHIEYIGGENPAEWQEPNMVYVVSPCNQFVTASLPMRQLCRNITDSVGARRPYINKASIRTEVTNHLDKDARPTFNDWAQPAEAMLLIREDKISNFFRTGSLPDDSTSILSTLLSETDSLDNRHYYYSFDLSRTITKELRSCQGEAGLEQVPDTIHMVLVPVDVISGSNGVTNVRHKQTISCTALRSTADDKWQVVYSGF